MASIIHYANHLCHLQGSGCMQDEVYAPFHNDAEAFLGLGRTEEELLAELQTHLTEAEPFFSLIEAN
jgi:hypothetical protein